MTLSTQRIPGGDLVENRCFVDAKLDNVCGFSDFNRGTMRQKMAIFKVGNSVWSGTRKFYEDCFTIVNVNEIKSL